MIADRVFTNCRIYTLDAGNTRAEAMAVKGEKILGVGSTDEIKQFIGPSTEVLDLGGKTVIPGCIDSHNHLMMHGIACTRSADLSDTASISELKQRLRKHLSKNPDASYLTGERFDQELFSDGRWPTRSDLDEVSSRIPIVIARLCYHAVVANSAALLPVKDKLTPQQWETGILCEDDCGYAWQAVPECTDEELERAAVYAFSEARRAGITSVHCNIDTEAEYRAIEKLRDEGRLPVRVRAQWHFPSLDKLVEQGIRTSTGDNYLKIGAIKIFMDGSFGARTCAMCEPFSDDPGNCGNLFRCSEELANMIKKAQKSGFQAAIHAIGDLAIQEAIKGIEEACSEGNEGNTWRHRIEHVAQMNSEMIRDMARLKIIAAVQPQFVITDFWTYERVGSERYRWTYPFKTMLEAGIHLAMGSDCPVERLSTMELLHRAVNREPRSAGECLTVQETLKAYTYGSAYAGFEEDIKGSLEPGKLADFAVLSEDPFEIDPTHLQNIKVENCAVGGNLL